MKLAALKTYKTWRDSRTYSCAPSVRRIGLTGVCALLLFSLFCDSSKGTKDLEKEQVYYLLMTNPASDTAACQAEETAAISCANSSGISTPLYVITLQSLYGVTVSAPQSVTEICAVLPSSNVFTNQSVGARVCIFQCSMDFWQRVKAANLCTSPASYTSLSTTLATRSDRPFANCLNTCLVQGTVFPGN